MKKNERGYVFLWIGLVVLGCWLLSSELFYLDIGKELWSEIKVSVGSSLLTLTAIHYPWIKSTLKK